MNKNEVATDAKIPAGFYPLRRIFLLDRPRCESIGHFANGGTMAVYAFSNHFL
ncbi:hypothetical protein HMP0721_1202 [Pseudoramibacter alactolyticus ATCC 23263]|uniref:Uncharacterized protein n=1 Tax=Pseudoramibacter alactolyticus ATCC 23263 TaxID=887929 RepID=E6MGR9_9FIRM|nr:hypothetical protein HMP0721_1202 [Pseudoramibacter alactolyticus ATCC 23263]